jgi:uncharacterized phage-like protein YoqJ
VELSKHVFSFIGHKPLELGGFDEENPINKWVKFSIKVMVSNLTSKHGDVLFLTGCQPGTETWASEEIISTKSRHPERNIHLEVVLPFKNMTGRNPLTKKPWPIQAHERFNNICSSADNVITLTEEGYSSWRIRSRDEWVIERSSGLLLVMKEGSENTQIVNALKFAEKTSVPVCIIDPLTERIYSL